MVGRSPPPLTADHALFLDFDGTLVDIVATPDAVAVTPEVRGALTSCIARLNGAVAIVTGRTVADVTGHLQVEHLTVSGSHGIERLMPDGRLEQPGQNVRQTAAAIQDALKQKLADYPKLLIEAKAWSAALHYRARPDLETHCKQVMEAVVSGYPDWEILFGDMLVEARLSGVTKGSAVRALMQEPVFGGRVPVFIGDDVTDEDGIAAAQDAGGYGIKVGEGESTARYRLEGPGAVLEYLGGADLTSER